MVESELVGGECSCWACMPSKARWGPTHALAAARSLAGAGATFVGPGVGEMLHAATIAVVGKVPVDTLWHAVPAFPTVSEVWLRLLEADRGV